MRLHFVVQHVAQRILFLPKEVYLVVLVVLFLEVCFYRTRQDIARLDDLCIYMCINYSLKSVQSIWTSCMNTACFVWTETLWWVNQVTYNWAQWAGSGPSSSPSPWQLSIHSPILRTFLRNCSPMALLLNHCQRHFRDRLFEMQLCQQAKMDWKHRFTATVSRSDATARRSPTASRPLDWTRYSLMLQSRHWPALVQQRRPHPCCCC